MLEQLKFSIGSMESGYKTVILGCENGDVCYEILHSGLLDIAKGKYKANADNDCITGWKALNISKWDAAYSNPHISNGEAWRLTVNEDGATYKSRGESAYPRQWNQFLNWLDALMPELAFVAADQIERMKLLYRGTQLSGNVLTESIIIDRQQQQIIIEKDISGISDGICQRKSRHVYECVSDIQEVLEILQGVSFSRDEFPHDMTDVAINHEISICGQNGLVPEYILRDIINNLLHPEISLDVSFHSLPDFHAESIPMWVLKADCEIQWNGMLRRLQGLMPDIETKLLSPETYRYELHGGKYIYCMVRLPNSYRLYSYRTEDETLQIGDKVDVPVGQDNDVICGKIEEIGYYNESNAPYPVHKTKLIIGKHDEDE